MKLLNKINKFLEGTSEEEKERLRLKEEKEEKEFRKQIKKDEEDNKKDICHYCESAVEKKFMKEHHKICNEKKYLEREKLKREFKNKTWSFWAFFFGFWWYIYHGMGRKALFYFILHVISLFIPFGMWILLIWMGFQGPKDLREELIEYDKKLEYSKNCEKKEQRKKKK